MARGVTPECRYEHGPLKLYKPPDGEPVYAAVASEKMRLNLGRGFTFEIWECQTCSYLELHDYDPDKL